jgi:MarR-like DNA-binding transcriptional regulator SgrR of sgrS sRNA
MLQYSHWTFDPLVRYAQDMSFEPRLAERWERVDDLTMRFHLRKGVKFHSGNPFTAKDVKFTFERFYNSEDFKGLFTPFESCTVVDDHTVDIKTKKPYALLINMATYIFILLRNGCHRTAQRCGRKNRPFICASQFIRYRSLQSHRMGTGRQVCFRKIRRLLG